MAAGFDYLHAVKNTSHTSYLNILQNAFRLGFGTACSGAWRAWNGHQALAYY
jgi:hypothetical protein